MIFRIRKAHCSNPRAKPFEQAVLEERLQKKAGINGKLKQLSRIGRHALLFTGTSMLSGLTIGLGIENAAWKYIADPELQQAYVNNKPNPYLINAVENISYTIADQVNLGFYSRGILAGIALPGAIVVAVKIARLIRTRVIDPMIERHKEAYTSYVTDPTNSAVNRISMAAHKVISSRLAVAAGIFAARATSFILKQAGKIIRGMDFIEDKLERLENTEIVRKAIRISQNVVVFASATVFSGLFVGVIGIHKLTWKLLADRQMEQDITGVLIRFPMRTSTISEAIAKEVFFGFMERGFAIGLIVPSAIIAGIRIAAMIEVQKKKWAR